MKSRSILECLFFGVIPAIPSRMLSGWQKPQGVIIINIEKTLDPRGKPEDDNLNCLFLFVIPAGLKRESSRNYGHFNLFTNEPIFFP